MKYEEIKIGDVFRYEGYLETVISKSDRHRIITTIDDDMRSSTWSEIDLRVLKLIKEELPEEGLLVSEGGSLVYKLSDGSGYGFEGSLQSGYYFNKLWDFSQTDYWQPATPEQEERFVKMLKKECEARGLHEDTKIESHANGYGANLNINHFAPSSSDTTEIFNKHGQIFHKGNFAKPLKESILDQVTEAVKDIADFTIEETESKLIILTPIKK